MTTAEWRAPVPDKSDRYRVTVPPLDVLLVTRALELSAATLSTLNLGGALVEHGLEVLAVTPGGPFEPVLRERRVPLEVLPHLATPALGAWTRHRLIRRSLGRGVGVVHCLSIHMLGVARALARRLGAPLVATVHGFVRPDDTAVDWADVAVVTVTDDTLRQDVVNRRRCPRDRVRVVHAGVAVDYEPLPPFTPGRAPVVGTVGELDKVEAQEIFLRAAREALLEVPDAQFLFVGDGAEPARLRALIGELGIRGNVTFTPVMDQRKALPIMDVCVLPSAEEGVGHVVLEAMVAGRPVIAAGRGGAFTAIKDEETGLLVERGDPSSLSAAIVRLLKDPALARQLGAEARAYALASFPLERMVDEVLAVYRQVRAQEPR